MWARILAFLVIAALADRSHSAQYLGKFIGQLSQLHHEVSGEVYAVDGRTLHIKDFTYDGQAPAAYWYANENGIADKNGFKVRDDAHEGTIDRRYRKESVTLTLPEGKTLKDIKILYVWCEEFDVSFGDVKIPRGFDFPRPQKIDALQGVHDISSDNIVIVDAQTLLVPNFKYDGEAPDAKFWVGRGSRPSPQGIRVANENGKEQPLGRYDGKTVVLTLPGDLTVFDIGHFGVWCEQFTVDFGHIKIPQGLNVPPSLKMLGVKPQSHNFYRKPLVVNDREGFRPATSSQRGQVVTGHLQPTTYRPTSLNFGLIRPNGQNQDDSARQPKQFGQLQQGFTQVRPASSVQQVQYSQFNQFRQYEPIYQQQQQIPFIQHQIQPGFIQSQAQERQDFGYKPLIQYQQQVPVQQSQFFQQPFNQYNQNQQRSYEFNQYQNVQPQQRLLDLRSNFQQGYQPFHQHQTQHRFDLTNQQGQNYVSYN